MRYEDTWMLSHRPYAVDLAGLVTEPPSPQHGHTWAHLPAVWFRKRAGVLAACAGELRDLQQPAPADARAFLAAHADGRYGGDCRARWDGRTLWVTPAEADPAHYESYLALLGPMLAAWPAVPAGYDGWWTFREARP
jgi:hypothetical protein